MVCSLAFIAATRPATGRCPPGPGSSASYLRIMPRFKAQSVGSSVYHTHSVVFESMAQRGMFLHASAVAYDGVPDPKATHLPKNLRTGRTVEANAAPLASAFVVRRFARFSPSTATALATGKPFRLFHSQSDAFVHASCVPEKGEDRQGGDRAPPRRLRRTSSIVGGGGDDDARRYARHTIQCSDSVRTRCRT